MPVLSHDRAMKIVERVAAKHHLSVATALCAKRDRYARICRAEIAARLKGDLGWSPYKIGPFLGSTPKNAYDLLGLYNLEKKRAHRVLAVDDIRAIAELERDRMREELAEARYEIAYLKGELERLTGASLVHRMASVLGVEKLRLCIVLAILTEAYPNRVMSDQMIDLYEDACIKLNYGRTEPTPQLITKNVYDLRAHFTAQGWVDPIISTENGTRVLSTDGARWLYERIGAPSLHHIGSQQIRSAA